MFKVYTNSQEKFLGRTEFQIMKFWICSPEYLMMKRWWVANDLKKNYKRYSSLSTRFRVISVIQKPQR